MADEKLWFAPDTELSVIRELNKHAEMLGCRVSAVKPDAVKHVQVIATGGASRNLIADDSQITITCWAGSNDWATAHRLAHLVRALLDAAAQNGDLAGREFYALNWINTPYKDQDPVTGVARVTQTGRFLTRGNYQTIQGE